MLTTAQKTKLNDLVYRRWNTLLDAAELTELEQTLATRFETEHPLQMNPYTREIFNEVMV